MDKHTPEQRRRNMQRVRSKDTSIEVTLRKALWCRGIRYRKNYSGIPGHPDIALTKYKIAIFCDSSFFHGRDYGTDKMPRTNADFWERKIRRNMERDKEVNAALRELGWYVLRFWDDEITKETAACIDRIKQAIDKQRTEI